MTKRELIEEVVRRYPRFLRQDAEVMVKMVFESFAQARARGEWVEVRGFGTFSVRQRRAGERRNPKTGEPVAVPAKKVPFFRVAKELRLRVDGKGPAAQERRAM